MIDINVDKYIDLIGFLLIFENVNFIFELIW